MFSSSHLPSLGADLLLPHQGRKSRCLRECAKAQHGRPLVSPSDQVSVILGVGLELSGLTVGLLLERLEQGMHLGGLDQAAGRAGMAHQGGPGRLREEAMGGEITATQSWDNTQHFINN